NQKEDFARPLVRVAALVVRLVACRIGKARNEGVVSVELVRYRLAPPRTLGDECIAPGLAFDEDTPLRLLKRQHRVRTKHVRPAFPRGVGLSPGQVDVPNDVPAEGEVAQRRRVAEAWAEEMNEEVGQLHEVLGELRADVGSGNLERETQLDA